MGGRIVRLLQVMGIFPVVKMIYWRLLGLASRSGFLSDVWYLFSGGFRREHRAVLAGRSQHKQGLKDSRDAGAMYTLRRNTHRLEKGLIMRPRRSVFALDYIVETTSLYKSLCKVAQSDASLLPSLNWSHDVLITYFECVDPENQRVAHAQKIFNTSEHVKTAKELTLRPYQRELDQPIGISVEDLHRLAIRRRSCRWFLQKPVPREIIDKAIEIGTLAPSACNRQPFQFRIFDKPEDAQRIGKIPGGTAGFHENFPCIAVLVGDLSAFPEERDRHIPYIDSSLAAMGFQFGLEVQGVSSCCINWPDVESREKAIAKAMNLQANERVIMLIAIGYPDPKAMVPYSQKKPLSKIRSYFAN